MPRSTPSLIISIPPYTPPVPRQHHRSLRGLVRLLSWMVLCTLVLWIFVLQADKPRLYTYTPSKHGPGGKYRPRPFRPLYQSQGDDPPSAARWAERAASVRSAFLHAYDGYREHAFLSDELLPVTGGGRDSLNGWGLTLHDSLDAMLVMGLSEQFQQAVAVVARQEFGPESQERSIASIHNTILHHIGSLLSVYAITKDTLFLIRADDLGQSILPALEPSPTLVIPSTDIDQRSSAKGNEDALSMLSLNQLSSGQLEFKYLAYLTGRSDYYHKVWIDPVITQLISEKGDSAGLWESRTSSFAQTSISNNSLTAYQYMLKQWLLSSQVDHRSLKTYLVAVNNIINHHLFLTPNRNLLYATDIEDGVPTHVFSHSTCSLPALLSIGVDILGIKLPLRDRELHLWAAQGLAHTCWKMYLDQTTGLGPARVQMDAWLGLSGGDQRGLWLQHVEKWVADGKKGNGPPGTLDENEASFGKKDYTILEESWALAPELVESFYVLWKTSGVDKWRGRAWNIFQNVEKHCRTRYGYAGILEVNHDPPTLQDVMPSHFLGQTLKYLYLIFSEEDYFPLRSWVFNARGHPLPVFEWAPWQIKAWNISIQ